MALPPNYDLLFHRQVKPIDIFLSRCILESAGATISFVVLTVIFNSLGLVRSPYDVLQVAGGWFLLMWYAFALGLLFGAVSERSESVERIWHIVMYLMLPLSGSFFLLSAFPPEVRSMLLWIPTVSCAEIVREGFFGPALVCYYSVGYVVIFNSLVLLFALIQLRIVSRNLTPA
jgi:ABC-type polysaccharide/polyol phosphate export permease